MWEKSGHGARRPSAPTHTGPGARTESRWQHGGRSGQRRRAPFATAQTTLSACESTRPTESGKHGPAARGWGRAETLPNPYRTPTEPLRNPTETIPKSYRNHTETIPKPYNCFLNILKIKKYNNDNIFCNQIIKYRKMNRYTPLCLFGHKNCTQKNVEHENIVHMI